MPDYEALRRQHVARMLEVLPESRARLTWPVDRLRAQRVVHRFNSSCECPSRPWVAAP